MPDKRARAVHALGAVVFLMSCANGTTTEPKKSSPREPVAYAIEGPNLVRNSTFDTEIAPNRTTQLDINRDIVASPSRMSFETSDTHDGRPGAVRVTYAADPPLYESATHNSGLDVPLNAVVPTGSWIKVTFWAKAITQPVLLAIMKSWGGSTPAFVSIGPTWQRYEGYTLAQQDTSGIIFTIAANANSPLQLVALGSYLMDDITVSVVDAPPDGCIAGVPGRDGDGDGTPDCRDLCPTDATNQCNGGVTPTLCGPTNNQPCKPACPNGQCATTLLDLIQTGARGAYSVSDRLSSSYTGPAFRVRRSADGAEANIGFGRINYVDERQVSDFCGASDCTLSLLFDQSGSGYDLTQPFVASQPKFYDGAAHALRTTNGRPVLALGELNKYLSRSGNLGLGVDPALSVGYVGRLSAGQVASKILPIRVGSQGGGTGSELALGYGTYANVANHGAGLLTWSNLRNGELHRSMFLHGQGAPVSASSMMIDGQYLSTMGDPAAASAHLAIPQGGSLLVGKLSTDSPDAEAELQTLVIWNRFLDGESAYTAQALMLTDQDLCPNDPRKLAPGVCGCGVPEANPCVIDTGAVGTHIPATPAPGAVTPLAPTLLPGLSASYHESTPPGNGYFSDLRYAPNDGQHEPPRFCDAYGNPIPTPSEAQLNAAPQPGSVCLAMTGTPTECPIDPESLTDQECTTDASCPAGYVCGIKCADALCTVLERYCGKHATTCGGLGPDTNCEDYNICPAPGSVGTAAEQAAAEAQRARDYAPTAQAKVVSTADQTPLPNLEPSSSVDLCWLSNQVLDVKDGSNKAGLNNPAKKWGVYADKTTDFGVTMNKSPHWVADVGVKGNVGFAFGGIVWGNKIDILSGEAKASVDDCGLEIVATVKVLGEAVLALTPQDGMVLGDRGTLKTNVAANKACQDRKKDAKTAQEEIRSSYLHARETYRYIKDNGITPEFCRSVAKAVPATHELSDASICDTLATVTREKKLGLVEHWKKEYDLKSAKYPDFKNALSAARNDVKFSKTFDVFELSHPYSFGLETSVPIGPLSLTLAFDLYGAWDVKGGVQVGLGFDTGELTSTLSGIKEVLASGKQPQEPNLFGDISAYAGPVVTPAATGGVVAYVGVGIPGVSVGIEGQLTLLDASLPTTTVAAVMRVQEEDRRDRTQTEYAGMLKPTLPNKNYRWVVGYNWNVKLKLQALNGKIDLAARLNLLIFKKTFRLNMVNWHGPKLEYILVGGGAGDALAYANNLGKQADKVAYTEVLSFADGDLRVTPRGPTPRACVIAPD